MRSNRLLVGAVVVVALAVGASLLYRAKKTHDLKSHAAEATALLREAIARPDDAGRLDAHLRAITDRLETLHRERAPRNKALAEAADLYLTDVQAIVRNLGNAARARAAAAASRRTLAAHIAAAGHRGPDWIRNALVLKQRAERDNFDYRVALGALAGLYRWHGESQARLRAVAPGVPLLEAAEVERLHKAAKDAEERAEAEIGRIRAMVM